MVPLPMRTAQADLERTLADCRPAVFVRGGEARPLHDAGSGEEGDACVLYTSGTTGAPKGVRLTGGNLLASALGCQESLVSTPSDRWLLCLSPHHVGGLSILIRSAVSNQAVTSIPSFKEVTVLEALRRERCTLLSVVPTMLVRLLEAGGMEPLRSLRAILLGGAPAPADRIREWARMGLVVCPSYGLTESASQVATVPPGQALELAGTAGFVHAHAGIEIVGGEIVVTGEVISPGYVSAAIASPPDGGRFITGDLGELTDTGALLVWGRRDDAIITGGENVYPEEVEAALREHPAVADAAVVGRADTTWGQLLTALVVLRRDVDEGELEAWTRARLPPWKVPRYYRRVERLPRSEGGKLLRREIQI
jgi:O-succinylbenzoic acid--CoA ligase